MKNKSQYPGIAMSFFALAFILTLCMTISCQKKETTQQHSSIGSTEGPLLPRVPYEYPVGGNDHLATLGRVLFYDKNLSSDKSVSCGSCHKQAYGFADNQKFSAGANGLFTSRNTHSITKMNNSRFWDGKNQLIFNDTLNSSCINMGYNVNSPVCQSTIAQTSIFKNPISIPFLTNSEMSLSLEQVSARIKELPYYQKLFSDAFPGDPDKVNEKNIQVALGTFLDNIIPSNSRFDQVIAAGGTQFAPDEMEGWNIFNGKGKCNLCHKANNAFGGNPGQFEDIGLESGYTTSTDVGRSNISGSSLDQGKFHIPSLRNISLTAPYMHDGRFRSLGEVINFFSDGVQNSPNLSSAFSDHPTVDAHGEFTTGAPASQLHLTDTEKAALLAFLSTLTDHTLVNDVRFSDPFKR